MTDTRPDYSTIRTTALKAIREKCLDCCCWQVNEVTRCHIVKCPLWRFRMGKEQKDYLYDLAHPNQKDRIYNVSGFARGASKRGGQDNTVGTEE